MNQKPLLRLWVDHSSDGPPDRRPKIERQLGFHTLVEKNLNDLQKETWLSILGRETNGTMTDNNLACPYPALPPIPLLSE